MSFYASFRFLLIVALVVAAGAFSLTLPPITAWAEEPCAVKHPFMPPKIEFKGQCPNCGMVRPMWARTWMTFENSQGKFGVCSFHCLADMSLKSGEEPKKVMVSLYLDPKKMVSADKAFFVVGSKAKGTMTMKSKLAFSSKEGADRFAKSCGGKVASFADAFKMAKQGVPMENKVIAKKRLKMGKIVEPVDNKNQCPVCGMYPARYPKGKSQILAKDKTVYHFCSTQCLFEFLKNAKKYLKASVKPFQIWVIDYPNGAWISAKTAYYVVGSKVQGPMGYEAFAFDKKKSAEDFARKEGGKVLLFKDVNIGAIKP